MIVLNAKTDFYARSGQLNRKSYATRDITVKKVYQLFAVLGTSVQRERQSSLNVIPDFLTRLLAQRLVTGSNIE